MQSSEQNAQTLNSQMKIVRSLSYNDLKKKRMLREEKSKKRIQSIRKIQQPGLTKSTTSTNITIRKNKYIKQVPLNSSGMTQFVNELKGVLTQLQKKKSDEGKENIQQGNKLAKNYSSVTSNLQKTQNSQRFPTKCQILKLDSLKTRIAGQKSKITKSLFSDKSMTQLNIKAKQRSTHDIEGQMENKEQAKLNYFKKTKRNSLAINFKQLQESYKTENINQLVDINVSPISVIREGQNENEKSELSLLNLLKQNEEKMMNFKKSKSKPKIPRDFFKCK